MPKTLNARYDPSARSTQEIAKGWVLERDRTYDAVYTDHQTAGRGRHGSQWHDEPGSSLLASYVLWEHPLPSLTWVLGLLVAAAAAQAMESILPSLPEVKIKYPNDLILHHRKVGGVLIEVVNGVAIAGVGINLAQEAFPEPLVKTAISLRQVLGKLPALSELRDTLLHQIWGFIDEILVQFNQDTSGLWRFCTQRDGTKDRYYRVLDLPGCPEGIALRLEPDFRLCMQLPDGSTHSTYFVESIQSRGRCLHNRDE